MTEIKDDRVVVKFDLSRICRNDCKYCRKYSFCLRSNCMKEDNDGCFDYNSWTPDVEREIRF